ncbi:hypothetical protein ABVF61_17245 [Roseibium sp. HPY-6]
MVGERLKQLADMLEAQVQILIRSGELTEAAVATREVASLRLLAEVSE